MNVLRRKSFLIVFLAVVATITVTTNSTGVEFELAQFETPDGVKYGTWGTAAKRPAPTLFVLAADIRGTLGDEYYRQCGNDLAKAGWLCVSIDLPCHGEQAKASEAKGLSGWSERAARRDDFVAKNNQRLSSVLDHLIQSHKTDKTQVAACGTSRGGFLAIHFAAHDPRVACVAAFAPVTDLDALREFRALKKDMFVSRLSASRQAMRLAECPVWIVIGDQDERVGTERAFAFAQSLTAASRKRQIDSRVEIHIMPEPRGHTTPRGSSTRAAAWIKQQMTIDARRRILK